MVEDEWPGPLLSSCVLLVQEYNIGESTFSNLLCYKLDTTNE